MKPIKAAFPAGRLVPASGLSAVNRDHLWNTFHRLKEARKLFGLSSGAVHTLCALLSFLKDGGEPVVFASNRSIQKRAVLDDDRTLRRHIGRLVEVGFITRQDSSNFKRYRSKDPVTGDTQAFGFNLSPFFARSHEIIKAAEETEIAQARCKHLRKTLLALLARLQADQVDFTDTVRKALRRKLAVRDYLAAIHKAEALIQELPATATHQEQLSAIADLTDVNNPSATERSGSDGQNVRHHSNSQLEDKDLKRPVGRIDDEQLMALTVETCSEAMAFAAEPVETPHDLERLASQLAPMMGIDRQCFERACIKQPRPRVALSTLLILQMGSRIRNMPAYFRSVTIGKRAATFDPMSLLLRLSDNNYGPAA
jgi:replication initiation protein RepC